MELYHHFPNTSSLHGISLSTGTNLPLRENVTFGDCILGLLSRYDVTNHPSLYHTAATRWHTAFTKLRFTLFFVFPTCILMGTLSPCPRLVIFRLVTHKWRTRVWAIGSWFWAATFHINYVSNTLIISPSTMLL